MSEQEQNSQLSALFDNQLPPQQAELVIRRALKDSALRATWGRYALIGACVRNEPVRKLRQPDVAERVRQRLAAEVEHPAQSAPVFASREGGATRWLMGRGALGGAIAAGVAVVSLFVVRSMDPQTVAPAMQMAQTTVPAAMGGESQALPVVQPTISTPLVAANDSPPPSYTTPVDNSPAQRINGQLVSLMVAHSDLASSMPIPVSALMNGSVDIAQGAVEISAAQVGAHR
jgi:negative regulator of sigma E activity